MVPEEKPSDPQTLQSTKPEHSSVREMHRPIMREKREPHDGREPVPLWVTFLFGALLFWGGAYTIYYAGDWRGDMLEHDPAALRGGGGGETGPVDPLVLGEKLYKAQCVSCHQASGLGQAGQYPPLAASPWVLGAPARLKRIVLHGLEGPIEVLGATYNGNMPTLAKRLNDERLSAVLTYIRQAWGNDAAPIPPESAAATRAATKDRKTPWTVSELEAIIEADWTAPPAPPPAEDAQPAGDPQDGG